jgi:hypothetical protein
MVERIANVMLNPLGEPELVAPFIQQLHWRAVETLSIGFVRDKLKCSPQ